MIIVLEILKLLSGAEYYGSNDAVIVKPVTPEDAAGDSGELMWLSDKNLFKLKSIKAGTIVCSQLKSEYRNNDCNYIVVKNPRSAFRKILENFFAEKISAGISKSSIIAKDVSIGSNIAVGEYSVIEKNCVIGNNVVVGSGTVIKSGTHIGNHVKIGSNCTIGGAGFGYEKDDENNWQHIPHIGNVIIKDYVSIHDNVVINKGVLNNTILDKHSKIDSMAMIAHGVKIGKNTVVCGQTSIAGSAVIGDNCWIAPNASILNKITIGNNVFVGIGAVVVNNVSDGKKIFGNPAKSVSF
jgi:UDP-3-O-[3-hydroxymyristoyl] glucosamine N-acyltransferase